MLVIQQVSEKLMSTSLKDDTEVKLILILIDDRIYNPVTKYLNILLLFMKVTGV